MRRLGSGGAVAAIGLGMLAALAAGAASAASTSAKLGVELGPQKTGSYGTVHVEEVGGALEFRVELASSLGKNADLHEFYFNLNCDVSGLRLVRSRCDGGSCETAFDLGSGGSTHGGAGARFDYSVDFGDGGSKKGNGNLQVASFRLEADAPLGLLPTPFDASFTSRDLSVIFAAHVPGSQGVAATIGATSAVVIPEPATAALFGVGMLGIAWAGRRAPDGGLRSPPGSARSGKL